MSAGCYEDLTGKKFGEWTVIKRVNDQTKSNGAKWLCLCSCGKEQIVWGKYLRNGTSKSCGCSKAIAKIGDKIGSFLITNIISKEDKGKRRKRYVCLCDCGNTVELTATQLRSRKHCGNDVHRKRKNYAGKTYGKLTIVRVLYNYTDDTHPRRDNYAQCECSCGKKDVLIPLKNLICGTTKSCGCTRTPDLTGKRFGHLTVVEQIENKNHQRRWLCLCDCGALTALTSHCLLSGHTKSCGCLRSTSVSQGELAIRSILVDNNIEYYAEHTFSDCVGVRGRPLRFDFFIPSINSVIEYDGYQHYHPVEYLGGEKAFAYLKNHDKIKNEYCQNNGIAMLRLPYTQTYQEMYKTIIDFLHTRIP